MIQWETVRHQVAIAGRVANAQTRRPLANARVQITAGPAAFIGSLQLRALAYGDSWGELDQRPDRVRTSPDGHFHFLDLPDGEYTLTASIPEAHRRYGTSQAVAVVARDLQGSIEADEVSISLRPTTLRGTVTNGTSAPVVMAQVRIEGSGESTFTNRQGQYALTGIQSGRRTVLITARGYQPVSRTGLLSAPGSLRTLNVTLTAAPS